MNTMQQFETPAPITAVLNIPGGRVRVVAADRADTTVEVLPSDASKRRDARAAAQTTVAYSGGVLRVETQTAKGPILGPTGSIEVTIQLPAGSGIQAKAAAAGFHGVGPLGDVSFDGAYGEVKLDEAASARLTVTAGDVQVGRVGGPAAISVQMGDITVAEAARGAVTLDTQYGRISIGAAHGVSATLDASTGSGRIGNALRNSEGADAELNIKATTGYGDVSAHSL
jgi:hypothetical protein